MAKEKDDEKRRILTECCRR